MRPLPSSEETGNRLSILSIEPLYFSFALSISHMHFLDTQLKATLNLIAAISPRTTEPMQAQKEGPLIKLHTDYVQSAECSNRNLCYSISRN